jgi:hypothetical protein
MGVSVRLQLSKVGVWECVEPQNAHESRAWEAKQRQLVQYDENSINVRWSPSSSEKEYKHSAGILFARDIKGATIGLSK